MPERVHGVMPTSTLRLASEAIRTFAQERMEDGTHASLFDICTACGHTYCNALVPEQPVKKACPHCKSDAPQVHVKLSW
jgi:Zn finger protein HypA/HybF involved in hydrogenase expression